MGFLCTTVSRRAIQE